MCDDFLAQRDELLVGQRSLRPVDLLVQNLGVLDAVFPATADGNDVIQRGCLRREFPAGQGTPILLLLHETKNPLHLHPLRCRGDVVPAFYQPGQEAEQVDATRLAKPASSTATMPPPTPVVDHVSERRCVQEANELARAEFWISEPRRDLRM